MKQWNEIVIESSNYKKFKKLLPSIIKGLPNLCYENARLEYHAQLKAHPRKSIKYAYGSLSANKKEEYARFRGSSGNWISLPNELNVDAHAFVIIDDKYVVDPTPFKYGMGDYNELPQEYGINMFEPSSIVYTVKRFVEASELLVPLKFFPK